MYDHDEEALFAMLLRVQLPADKLAEVRGAMVEIGRETKLSIRVWSPEERVEKPRLAICVTYRPEPPLAVLRAIRDGHIQAEAGVLIRNRPGRRRIAEQFGVALGIAGDCERRVD